MEGPQFYRVGEDEVISLTGNIVGMTIVEKSMANPRVEIKRIDARFCQVFAAEQPEQYKQLCAFIRSCPPLASALYALVA